MLRLPEPDEMRLRIPRAVALKLGQILTNNGAKPL